MKLLVAAFVALIAPAMASAQITRLRRAANESRLSPKNARLRLGRAGQPSSSNRAQPRRRDQHAPGRDHCSPRRDHCSCSHDHQPRSLLHATGGGTTVSRCADRSSARRVERSPGRGHLPARPRRALEAVRRSQEASALAHRGVARCFRAPRITHRVQRSIHRARTSIHQVVSRVHRAAASIRRSRTAFIECWTALIECWTAFIEYRTAATEARPSLIESSISLVRRPLSDLSGRACQGTRLLDDVRLSLGLVWPGSRHGERRVRHVSHAPRHRRGGSRDLRGAPGHERRQMRRVSNSPRH